MSPEPGSPATQELPVRRERLEQFWHEARNFLERTCSSRGIERRLIEKEDRLIEVEGVWNEKILNKIAIRSWHLYLPQPRDERSWDPIILRLVAEMVVNNPGVLATPDGQGKESYGFYGKVDRDWVDSIDFPISRLLTYPYLSQTR